jgi:hypothetical protein
MSLNEVIYFIYIFLTIRTTHIHYKIYVQHRYAKKKQTNDVMVLFVISSYRIFSLLFLKYDLPYVRSLCVFVLDDELLCESVGEFDKLPDDVFNCI